MKNAIKYYSLLEPSGYGLSAIAYIESLLALNIKVYWTPLVQGKNEYMPWPWLKDAQQQVRTLVEQCVDTQIRVTALIDCLEPIEAYQCIVMHTIPEFWSSLIEPGGYHIGYSVWETSRLPQQFPALINQVDKVLVPTEFNRSVFQRSGITIPIGVVPHILDNHVRLLTNRANQKQASKIKNFVFYTINEWSARKAPWTLLHCYLKAFTLDDSVELCIKTSPSGPASEQDANLHNTAELVQKIQDQYPNPARIRLIHRPIKPQQIAALHRDGDCYISTTHCEGWGLGAFEAAGYGNPVIMTGWGGQLDFLPKDLAYLIRYHLVNVDDKRGAGSYSIDQRWAKVDAAHTIDLMREVYQNQKSARERARRLAHKLKNEFNAKLIGRKLYEELFLKP